MIRKKLVALNPDHGLRIQFASRGEIQLDRPTGWGIKQMHFIKTPEGDLHLVFFRFPKGLSIMRIDPERLTHPSPLQFAHFDFRQLEGEVESDVHFLFSSPLFGRPGVVELVCFTHNGDILVKPLSIPRDQSPHFEDSHQVIRRTSHLLTGCEMDQLLKEASRLILSVVKRNEEFWSLSQNEDGLQLDVIERKQTIWTIKATREDFGGLRLGKFLFVWNNEIYGFGAPRDKLNEWHLLKFSTLGRGIQIQARSRAVWEGAEPLSITLPFLQGPNFALITLGEHGDHGVIAHSAAHLDLERWEIAGSILNLEETQVGKPRAIETPQYGTFLQIDSQPFFGLGCLEGIALLSATPPLQVKYRTRYSHFTSETNPLGSIGMVATDDMIIVSEAAGHRGSMEVFQPTT